MNIIEPMSFSAVAALLTILEKEKKKIYRCFEDHENQFKADKIGRRTPIKLVNCMFRF